MIGMHHESDCMFLYTFYSALGSMALTSTTLTPMVTQFPFKLRAINCYAYFNSAVRGLFGKAKRVKHMHKQRLNLERDAMHKLFVI
jgi:hypothetical protein